MTTDDIHLLQSKIEWVADALIPKDRDHAMPSASEVGIFERLLPRALKERDDMAPSFFRALARLPEDSPPNPLEAIRALGSDDFYVISFLIAGAYFLDEAVTGKLRYPGQEALYETPDYDEIMETVERVQERGSVYLDVPEPL
ncbi:hypothetical protein [Rhizobium leguminosarum]|uniref:hypothetical protein n=1 Tax=Rhizobium leguminosarum TaxID=384 RepID=UPI00098F0C55|nr:hypothetical protein [Rhizobium leguminosarum]ASS58084.1 hypothetical protein CHR56_25970 [Rhizobium leguminosarum bv. viciae]MBB4330013.1 hypothetical protein [Rhizobium leguminosarum]MBB4355408.1 hypothetical protein [Rhizobium leguminosarum]MBB4390017.1 hypothetical protein [Rhizobium leguminosarum]MBB4550516.1 hypothetical protein [Rhizobium leguminosarum]